jgi:peroxiredoxin
LLIAAVAVVWLVAPALAWQSVIKCEASPVVSYTLLDGHRIDTVAVATRYDPPAVVAHFAESRQLLFGVVIDNIGEIARCFGDVELTPTSFLIDTRGNIVKRLVGAPDFATLHQLIDKLLAEA